MIKIVDILNVKGSIYDSNITAIKKKIVDEHGGDVKFNFYCRVGLPDQIIVYKEGEGYDSKLDI